METKDYGGGAYSFVISLRYILDQLYRLNTRATKTHVASNDHIIGIFNAQLTNRKSARITHVTTGTFLACTAYMPT